MNGTIRRISAVIICTCSILLIVPAHADMITPAITHVFFEKGGVPYNGSVQYSVNCYGYFMGYPPVTKSPDSYQPELIFRYSATCPGYGCGIYQPYYYYGHSDWCDLEGQTENESFEIRNFSSYPYTRCDFVWDRVEKQWGNTREYYYHTPEYSLCRQVTRNLSETWHASRDYYSETQTSPNRTSLLILPGYTPLYRTPGYNSTVIQRSDIPPDTNDYIAYLETCDPVADPKCPGWVVNGTALKTYPGLRPLKDNATDLRENPCDRFLIRADPSLIMPFTERDPWHHPCIEACNYTYQVCESRFTIPSSAETPKTESRNTTGITVPWTVMDRPYSTPTMTTRATESPAPNSSASGASRVSRSPVEALYCGIMQVLGGKCE